jgi:hypothetical protein
VSGYDDDDDWVGTPPEGRYSRDRAKPEFWARQWQARVAGGVVALILIVLVVAALILR